MKKYRYEIEYVNQYGHIVKNFVVECDTDKQAIKAAKNDKDLYPECYIEIICFDTLKRIYA